MEEVPSSPSDALCLSLGKGGGGLARWLFWQQQPTDQSSAGAVLADVSAGLPDTAQRPSPHPERRSASH